MEEPYIQTRTLVVHYDHSMKLLSHMQEPEPVEGSTPQGARR